MARKSMEGLCVRCLLFLCVCITTSWASSRRHGQQSNADSNGFEALLNAAMAAGLGNQNSPANSIIPTTPRPEDVECYVEIPAVRERGRCVRLGRGRRVVRGGRRQVLIMRGCQAGVHLDIGSPDCN